MPTLPASTASDLPGIDAKGNALVTALEWLLDKVAGSPAGDGHTASDETIDRWITLACTGAGAAGFVANMGGAITLPVAVPANLISLATIQLTLVGKIARARGYVMDNPEVRTTALACLTGNSAVEIVKEAGIQLGKRLTQAAINQISAATLAKVNQAIGYRLIGKAGQAGFLNLTKLVPVAGGLIGGSVDALSTKAVGMAAKLMFPPISQTPAATAVPRPTPPPTALLSS